MIRKFVQCKDTEARLQLLAQTKESDWSDSELDTIMTILGLREEEDLTKDEKWSKILCRLIDTAFHEKKELEGSVFKDIPEERNLYEEDIEELGDLHAYLKVCNVA